MKSRAQGTKKKDLFGSGKYITLRNIEFKGFLCF